MTSNQVVSDEEAYDTMYMGGKAEDDSGKLVQLTNLSYEKYNTNFAILNKVKKIVPKELNVHKPKEGDTNIDYAIEALRDFSINYDHNKKELAPTLDYKMDDFNRDKKKRQKLKRDTLFEGKEDVPIQQLLRDRTEDLAKALKEGAKELQMSYFDTTKNFIQCSNLVEFYDFKDKDNKWVFSRLQKIHNAREHSNSIKLHKKKGDK